jgi:hypothetical protein
MAIVATKNQHTSMEKKESCTDFDIPLMPLGTIPGFDCGVFIVQKGR